MKYPQKYLRDYLQKLVDSLLYLTFIDDQLKLMKSWEDPRRIEALRIGSNFFSLVAYSFYRTLLIEINKLVSCTEDRSIVDFLLKLKEHIETVSPTRYNLKTKKREVIKLEVYKTIIERHLRLIHRKIDVIAKIKGFRDKVIAHSDKKYFNNPHAVLNKYHMDNAEIDELLSVITKVLKFHYGCLLKSNVDIKVHSSSDMNSVLVYVRAFDRVWHNKYLNNIKKYAFKLDDYEASSII